MLEKKNVYWRKEGKRKMEESLIISTFCKNLTSFCKHIETSSEALKESVQRRPIPLDSASSTFIQCLNRRVSSASSDLNLLESMAFGTVSFEELLGHCNELYKKNQTDLIELEDRFKNFGYIPAENDDEDLISGLMTPIGMESKLFRSEDKLDLFSSFSCEPRSIMKRLEEDPLFDESLSLQNLGFSDVCLATLASEVKTEIASPDMMPLQTPINFDDRKLHGAKTQYQPSIEVLGKTGGELRDNPKSDGGATLTVINVSKDDYDNLPSFMKTLSSWEDLSAAVEKMNSNLRKQEKQEKPKDSNLFHQDELLNLDLGPKVRSYLLLLLRMNRLVVETVDGSIVYRVL